MPVVPVLDKLESPPEARRMTVATPATTGTQTGIEPVAALTAVNGDGTVVTTDVGVTGWETSVGTGAPTTGWGTEVITDATGIP